MNTKQSWTPEPCNCGEFDYPHTREYPKGKCRKSTPVDMGRYIRCVQSLAGIRNPEAVKELIGIFRDALDFVDGSMNGELTQKMENALKNLDIADALPAKADMEVKS